MNSLKLAIIGSSGAGLPILKTIFDRMPRLQGTIVLIQHMPSYINLSLCQQLASQTELAVKLAEQNDLLMPGTLYVAPSERHFSLVFNKRVYFTNGGRVNYVCPSIDVAMLSLTKDPPVSAMGILLSGVGDDGIRGIRHIKQLGGVTVALDEKTSTITSMAREAVATGDVDFVLAPDQIRRKLIDHLDKAASG